MDERRDSDFLIAVVIVPFLIIFSASTFALTYRLTRRLITAYNNISYV